MITKELEHIPKGGMCATCVMKYKILCSKLDFKSMPKIGKGDQDGVIIVQCTEYKRG